MNDHGCTKMIGSLPKDLCGEQRRRSIEELEHQGDVRREEFLNEQTHAVFSTPPFVRQMNFSCGKKGEVEEFFGSYVHQQTSIDHRQFVGDLLGSKSSNVVIVERQASRNRRPCSNPWLRLHIGSEENQNKALKLFVDHTREGRGR